MFMVNLQYIIKFCLSFSLPLFVLFLYSISNTYWNFGRIEICIINPPARCMCPPAGQSTHYDFKWNIKVDDNISWFFCVQSLSLWHSPRKPFNSQLELCICQLSTLIDKMYSFYSSMHMQLDGRDNEDLNQGPLNLKSDALQLELSGASI